MVRYYCLAAVLSYLTCGVISEGPVVETSAGRVRGLAAADGDYHMYLGIPYATIDPSNPFGLATPRAPFEDTFEANDDAIMCPQLNTYMDIPQSLDCLRLNIYVPRSASTTSPLPVMVWIHGGGFMDGYGGRIMQHPKFLLRHDVVFVSINYRVGVYGFLCLDHPQVPGNQGLKDQLTALRWVKNNIEAFGGDKDKITLFGESAGGASVDFQFLYTNENLFKNVIIQSGTAMIEHFVIPSKPDEAVKLAKMVGKEADSTEDALQFLSTVDASKLSELANVGNVPYAPCVEKEFGQERFVTEHPREVAIPNAKDVSIMIGFTSNEVGVNVFGFNYSIDPFEEIGRFFDHDEKLFGTLADKVRRFYIGDEDFESEEMAVEIGNFHSDFMFYSPTYRSMRRYFENGASSIYHYMFSYVGERNLVRIMLGIDQPVEGALHGDELGYIFDVPLVNMSTPNAEDQVIIDRMTTMWTNFAKYSNPTPESSELLLSWPAVSQQSMYCLDLDAKLRIIRRPFHARMAFWDMFYALDEEYSSSSRNRGMRVDGVDLSYLAVFLVVLFSLLSHLTRPQSN